MDQASLIQDLGDSFRSLLNASRAASGGSVSQSKAYNRGSLLASSSTSTKPAEAPQAAFKPRKVKKAVDSKYRNRAAERRDGINEYAEVEGILEDFEKRMAGEDREVANEQRKYLGGDATHTVLVKGLDFALLEQQRAREESRDDLDDDLESAFLGKPSESAPTTSAPAEENQGKKRTRAELLAELQRSRQANLDTNATQNTIGSTREEEIEALERAKQAGKFKPMGASSFAPVEKKKKKKKKTIEGQEKTRAKDEGGEITKAKAPIPSEKPAAPRDALNKQESTISPVASSSATQDAESQIKAIPESSDSKPLAPAPPAVLPPAPPQSVEEIEDVDPFGDVGEYEPEYGDDSDAEGGETKNASPEAAHSNPAPSSRRNWFNDPELEPAPAPIPTKQPTPPQSPKEAKPESHLPTRLEGLTSSAMPSISDYLAMDKDEEAREKKRARKEKNKKKVN